MNRLKLIGAALLLVIFDTYTASADPKSSAPSAVSVESGIDARTASVIVPANDVVVITTPVQTSSGEVAVIQQVVIPE